MILDPGTATVITLKDSWSGSVIIEESGVEGSKVYLKVLSAEGLQQSVWLNVKEVKALRRALKEQISND